MSECYLCTECSMLTTKGWEDWGHLCPGQGSEARCESHLVGLAIVEVNKIAKLQAVAEAAQPALEWIEEIYPDDIFTGASDDEGAVKIVAIREALKEALARLEDVE